jgi:hypothetical protein
MRAPPRAPGEHISQEVDVKPDRARVLSEGLITGLVGALTVILFYGILNLAEGHSFFATAERLGLGLVTARAGEAGAVLAFNGLHVVVFLLIGLVAAWLVMETEKHPSFFILALFIGVAGLFAVLAAFLSFSASTGAALPIATILVASLAAGIGMGAYLLKAHPRLWAEIRDHIDPDADTEGL